MADPDRHDDQPHPIVINERSSGRGMILLFALLALLGLGIYYALHQTDAADRRDASIAEAKADTGTPSGADAPQ